nr:immunoglobulin heavy chain junction region [Macaca mulatta]MOX60453.1 immunoglobulin heavy chain junction region [Macaca mulatta]MOX61353.1 immunoglobulin heavy chain junction region [Macaca mulatta]MOX62822.1 immunoglobulin heavy chain junction region [Macaca mulatta]MOX67131.1 immunoglobulin heavy chain junction region [Macaca mulatta]
CARAVGGAAGYFDFW